MAFERPALPHSQLYLFLFQAFPDIILQVSIMPQPEGKILLNRIRTIITGEIYFIQKAQMLANLNLVVPWLISLRALAVFQTWPTKRAINKAPILSDKFPHIRSHNPRNLPESAHGTPKRKVKILTIRLAFLRLHFRSSIK